MFVINLKLSFKKILFACILIAAVVATIIEFGSNNSSIGAINNNNNYDYVLTDENFTTILKQIHDNIDENLGKTIKISGFVFKMPDFKDGYFVCGRNVVKNNENAVAGFLCQHQDSSKLIDNEWIEITGVIIKGEYNGTMPIIKVGNIKKITAPANTFVEIVEENKENAQ